MKHHIKYFLLAVMAALGTMALAGESHAAACANGVYRAGCVGPNGAAVVHKQAKPTVSCAKGPNRAGCAGPNGAAVVRRPY